MNEFHNQSVLPRAIRMDRGFPFKSIVEDHNYIRLLPRWEDGPVFKSVFLHWLGSPLNSMAFNYQEMGLLEFAAGLGHSRPGKKRQTILE